MPFRLSKDEFSQVVQSVLAELPPPFAQHVEEVPVEILDRASRDQMRGLGLGSGEVLLGLYRGRPRTQRSVEDHGTFPDVIYLFQDAIESVCDSRASVFAQIRSTLLHEIGHHFGMSEADLDRLGFG